MRLARLGYVFAFTLALGALAACGGGGGSTPNVPSPTGTPGGPPPPTATPKPSSSPTTSPTHSPTPTASPSPTPTQSPTPKPTPTASPTPKPSPSATPNRTQVRGTGNGEINGDDTMFPGGKGEDPNDGDYPAGGHGPLTSPPQTIGPDNVPCLQSMDTGLLPPQGTGYHVHSFVGIYYNGKEVALPDGLGFADPLGDATFNGIPNWTNYATMCYYEMHTHDASGMIHEESANAPLAFQQGAKYTLGDFLAVWGISISSNNLGPLTGPVSVYTSGQFARGGPGTKSEIGSNTYTLYTGDPTLIGLYSHEVIWITVGTGNPVGSNLPNVLFFTEW